MGRQQEGKVKHANGGGPEKGGNVTARTYTQEEWVTLTKEEREKIKQLRKTRKKARRKQKSGVWNASAMQQECDDDDDDDSTYSGASSDGDTSTKRNNVSSLSKEEASAPLTPTRRSGRSLQG
jgi:hypothetical protein